MTYGIRQLDALNCAHKMEDHYSRPDRTCVPGGVPVIAAENFHELKCSKKIRVVVCGYWTDCVRFAAPFLMGQRTSADYFGTNCRMRIQNQNRSLVRVLRMLRQPWISEGGGGSWLQRA